jgi:hypothetical protein
MVGDDPVAGLALARRVGPGELARRGDQRLERVRLVIVVGALHDGGDPLQPHAGVDRRLGQIADDLIVLLLILHEDQVPDLDEAVAVLVRRSRRPAGDMIAMVVEDFRAGAARAAVAHRPEIVLGRDPDDPAFGQAGDLAPKVEGLVVRVVDGRGQPVRRQAPFLRQKGPGVGDRLLLEIVAEREVAEHLEEGVVARGVADIVEIVMLAARPDAFLRRGGGRIGPGLEAGEDVLERHHSGVDEHQSRVVLGNERRRGDLAVSVRAEIVEERPADVVGGGHGAKVSHMLRCGKLRRPSEGWGPGG